MRYVIGIDGGTESLRAAVFRTDGSVVGSHAVPYATAFPKPGWAEQNPADWWSALGEAAQGAVRAAGVPASDIAALCADTTCCTVCALDESESTRHALPQSLQILWPRPDVLAPWQAGPCACPRLLPDGDAVRPALLWCDMRSAPQAARIAATGDPALRVNSAGKGPVSAEWMLCKSLWLKEKEPDTWSRAARVCEYQDYINYKLTGRYVASLNNVSVRWHYDVNRGWPVSLLESVGLQCLLSRWPPEILRPGDIVGTLTPAAAQHLGLPQSVMVVQGGADAFIGMLGLGVTEPGQMALLTGSSHLQLGLSAQPVNGTGIFGSYDSALLPGLHVVEGGQTSTGSIVAWFKRTLCGPEVTYATLDREAEGLAPGCDGLYCLDHFQGNRTPHTDALSRGALSGLTLAHTRGHVFRAVLEGVAKGTRLILDTMAKAGYRPESITIAGGAARSTLWLQAAVAAGLHPDIRAASKAMVRVTDTIRPRPDIHTQYAEHYTRYCQLYPALAPLQYGRGDAALGGGTGHTANGHDAMQGQIGEPHPPPQHHAQSEGGVTSPGAPHPGPAMTLVSPSKDPPHTNTHDTPTHTAVLDTDMTRPTLTGVISSSILAADFARLADEVSASVASGAVWVHVDMFDGTSMSRGNFTIGPPVVHSLKQAVPHAFLDCHLGVEDPVKYVTHVMDAGASSITFHIEAPGLLYPATLALLRSHHLLPEPTSPGLKNKPDLQPSRQEAASALARFLRSRGVRVGLALCPSTPPHEAIALAKEGVLDMVLCMTVEPGFGGQKFMESVLPKVRALRDACPDIDIQVDGGINAQTAPLVVNAGANVLVAGSAVYNKPTASANPLDRYRDAVGAITRAFDAQGIQMRG